MQTQISESANRRAPGGRSDIGEWEQIQHRLAPCSQNGSRRTEPYQPLKLFSTGGKMRRWVSSHSYQVAIGVLVEARGHAGLTQRDLASRLGKPRSFVAKIETGERRLDFVEFVAIARELGTTAGSLIDRIDTALVGRLDI